MGPLISSDWRHNQKNEHERGREIEAGGGVSHQRAMWTPPSSTSGIPWRTSLYLIPLPSPVTYGYRPEGVARGPRVRGGPVGPEAGEGEGWRSTMVGYFRSAGRGGLRRRTRTTHGIGLSAAPSSSWGGSGFRSMWRRTRLRPQWRMGCSQWPSQRSKRRRLTSRLLRFGADGFYWEFDLN